MQMAFSSQRTVTELQHTNLGLSVREDNPNIPLKYRKLSNIFNYSQQDINGLKADLFKYIFRDETFEF